MKIVLNISVKERRELKAIIQLGVDNAYAFADAYRHLPKVSGKYFKEAKRYEEVQEKVVKQLNCKWVNK